MENVINVKLKDKNGNIICPATKTSLLVNEDGTPANIETRLVDKANKEDLNLKADKTGVYSELTAGKVAHKLTFTGGTAGTFDGSADLTINISGGGSGPIQNIEINSTQATTDIAKSIKVDTVNYEIPNVELTFSDSEQSAGTPLKSIIVKSKEGTDYYNILGSSSYVLPQATISALGGIKAAPKTAEDTQEVHIDTSTGKLYTKVIQGIGFEPDAK